MITNFRSVTFIAILGFATALANADTSSPSYSCPKPGKAAEIKSQEQADKFNEAVSKYKACIEAFVQQQTAAVENHQRAASQAITEWNDFVANDMKR